MSDKFDALVKNSTWELVPQASRDVVDCKWIFLVKPRADGLVDKFKAGWWLKVFYMSLVRIISRHLVQWLNQ